MVKKISFVFLLALMSQLIVACVNCNCPPVKTVYFTNRGISLKNMDLSLPQSMVTNSGLIAAANYGIQVDLIKELLVLNRQPITWSIMQSAYACSCSEDNFISKEDILSLKIFSNEDFDSDHPKSTDLSLYFKVKKSNVMVPVADYIKSLKDFNDVFRDGFYGGIFLQVTPKINKKHKFKVIITLSDGRILEAETTQVELS